LELTSKISGIGGREISLVFEGLEDGFQGTKEKNLIGMRMGIYWSSQIHQNIGFSIYWSSQILQNTGFSRWG
jgi:hypothetical protein